MALTENERSSAWRWLSDFDILAFGSHNSGWVIAAASPSISFSQRAPGPRRFKCYHYGEEEGCHRFPPFPGEGSRGSTGSEEPFVPDQEILQRLVAPSSPWDIKVIHLLPPARVSQDKRGGYTSRPSTPSAWFCSGETSAYLETPSAAAEWRKCDAMGAWGTQERAGLFYFYFCLTFRWWENPPLGLYCVMDNFLQIIYYRRGVLCWILGKFYHDYPLQIINNK